MVSDARAQQARAAHKAALASITTATRHRDRRDQLIRSLRAEDPARWTYTELARVVGCSPELIAVVIRNRPLPPQQDRRRH